MWNPVPLSRKHTFSPLHTKESARSLFKSEEPWELLLSTGMPHPIPTTSCKNHPTIPPIPCHPCAIPIPCHPCCQDLNSQTSEPKDRFAPAPRAAKAAARRAPGAPEKAGTKATALLSRRGSAPTLQTGAASVWKILGKQWIKMEDWWDHWIVDCNASISLWKCSDDKMSWFHVVAIGPNDALASSPNLHAFKLS